LATVLPQLTAFLVIFDLTSVSFQVSIHRTKRRNALSLADIPNQRSDR